MVPGVQFCNPESVDPGKHLRQALMVYEDLSKTINAEDRRRVNRSITRRLVCLTVLGIGSLELAARLSRVGLVRASIPPADSV